MDSNVRRDGIQVRLQSEQDTDLLGAILANAIREGTVVNLNGTLGAGKTRLAKAIGASLGFDREAIVSPTYTLCNEYSTHRGTLFHLDLYRITDEDELFESGFEEYCNDENAITLIEWGNRFEAHLPDSRIDVTIEVSECDDRIVQFHFVGSELADTKELFVQQLAELKLN